MNADRNQLEYEMLQFIRSKCPQCPELAVDTDLLEDSLLDSLLLMDLIFQIEDLYGIRLATDQINPSNFRNISAIVGVVLAQMNSHTT